MSYEIKERQDDQQKERENHRKHRLNIRQIQTRQPAAALCYSPSQHTHTHTPRASVERGYHCQCVEKRGSKKSIYHVAHRPAMPKRHFMAHHSLSHTHINLSPYVNIYLALTTSCALLPSPRRTIMQCMHQISKNL